MKKVLLTILLRAFSPDSCVSPPYVSEDREGFRVRDGKSTVVVSGAVDASSATRRLLLKSLIPILQLLAKYLGLAWGLRAPVIAGAQ
jgi:hypothetical protein